MADNVSTLTRANRLNMQISGLLAALDIDIIGKQTAKVVTQVKQAGGDLRLDIRDWEMADSRVEMQNNAAVAQKRLVELRRHILKASENGIFSAIDVIDLSAQLDAIEADLG